MDPPEFHRLAEYELNEVARYYDLENWTRPLDALRSDRLRHQKLSGGTPDPADQRMCRLRQEDSVITRVSAAIHQLLEPLASGEVSASVDPVMHVVGQSAYPMWGTLNFSADGEPVNVGGRPTGST